MAKLSLLKRIDALEEADRPDRLGLNLLTDEELEQRLVEVVTELDELFSATPESEKIWFAHNSPGYATYRQHSKLA